MKFRDFYKWPSDIASAYIATILAMSHCYSLTVQSTITDI